MRKKLDLVLLLFFVSGFGGLIYQSIWSHYAKLLLGHAAYAQTLVLVVFIGGLALGAWLVSRYASRVANPLRVYAMVELGIGAMALGFHRVFVGAMDWSFATLLPAACQAGTAFCPAQWLLAAALLAPQSILLGATFPLVSSAVLRDEATHPGHDISSLYFVNSFGAVLGVLASAFVLIPRVGLPGTLMAAGSLNVLIATAAWLLARSAPPPFSAARLPAEPAAATGGERLVGVLLVTALLTGLSSFVYEIAWIRMLSLVLGATTHSFELMLATFILGLAIGGAWIRRRIDQLEDPVGFLARVQLAMGALAALTIPLYIASFDFMAWLLGAVARNDAGYLIFSLTCVVIAMLVMLPATICAGMTLPLITYRLLHSREGERALGKVYAVNTLGGILGVLVAVHLLMELVGLRGALLVGAAVDVGLGIYLLARAVPDAARRAALRGAAPAAVLVLAVITVAAPIDPRRSASGVFRTGAARMSPGVEVPFHRDGKTATVTVLQDDNARAIRTNGKPDASLAYGKDRPPTADEFTMALLGVLPLGHRPDARSAAVIGFGSGMTTAVLLASPTLERVDTIEIERAMVEGARHFRPAVEAAYADPRSRIIIDDAKSFFARGGRSYDIIVSEPSNPWVSGVASLFTEDFYLRVRGYLSEGGVFCQWLHTYEIDTPTFASIILALSRAFPDFIVYTTVDSDIVLIARKSGAAGAFDARVLQLPALQPVLAKLKLTEPEVVIRRREGSAHVLRNLFFGERIGVNSDFYPVVDQRASRTRFTRARVDEFTDLAASAMPLREMLDRAPPPSPRRQEVIPVTFTDNATAQAWAVHDAVLGGPAAGQGGATESRELSARLAAQWADACSAQLGFAHVLPALVGVAEATNPYLPPEVTVPLWRRIGDGRCARALPPAERRWLDLFMATARRDPRGMAGNGAALLDATRGWKNAASEYAFFATATALVCGGHAEPARALLADSAHWVRPEVRRAELRVLTGLATTGSPPSCPALAR